MVKCDTELEFKSDLGMMVEYQIKYISYNGWNYSHYPIFITILKYKYNDTGHLGVFLVWVQPN